MASAFLYLVGCSIRNRVRVRLRRLRQPRYLAATAAGALYLYAFAFRHAMTRPARLDVSPLGLFARASDTIAVAGALALFAMSVAAWAIPLIGRPIEFTRAEAQFLLQAPIRRRHLLHYKLLRGQLGVLLATAVTTLFLRPGSLAVAGRFLIGAWMLLATVRLHLTGVALRRLSIARHGVKALRDEWVPLGIVGAACVTLVASFASDWRSFAALTSAGAVFREVERLASSGPAHWVLWPFGVLVRLPLAAVGGPFLRLLPAALGIVSLNYLWVVRADAVVGATAADDAAQRAHAEAAVPVVGPGRLRVPFRLAATGRPETAILWKNLILLGRYASARTLLGLLPLLLLAVVVSGRSSGGIGSSIGILSLAGAGMTVLLGPQMMRSDLRQDLANLALLKAWPVGGPALVRGELLAPAVLLSCVSWLLIGAAVAFVRPNPGVGLPALLPERAVSLALAAGVLAPAVIVGQLVIQNGLAILFPAWVATATARSRGIDAMGQRLLTLGGVVFALVLLLLPGAFAGAGVWSFVRLLVPAPGGLLIVLPALAVAAVVLGECWLAVEWLGRVFDATDAASMDPME